MARVSNRTGLTLLTALALVAWLLWSVRSGDDSTKPDSTKPDSTNPLDTKEIDDAAPAGPAPELRPSPAHKTEPVPDRSTADAAVIPPFRFRVTSAAGQPLAEARVTRTDGPRRMDVGLTDTDGRLEFVVPMAGITAIRIVVEKAGFRRHAGQADRSHLNEVRLEAGIAIEGLVLETGTEAAIAGATVRAFTAQGHESVGGPVVTDARGHFVLDALPIGRELFLVARPKGFHAAAIKRTFPSDEPVVLHVGGGGTLEGRVVRADGTPASDVLVWLVRPQRAVPPRDFPGQWVVDPQLYEFFYPHVKTDADGRYTIRGIARNEPRVAVAWFSERVEIAAQPATFKEPGETLRRDLALPALGVIKYRVLDDQGRVLEGVQVDFTSERIWFDAGQALDITNPAEEGWLTVRDLVPGRWTLRAWLPGADVVEQAVDVGPGEEHVVTLAGKRGGVIEGVVVDTAGTPVAGASLTWYDGSASRSCDAGPDGRFRLTAIPPTAGELEIATGLWDFDRRTPLAPEAINGVRAGSKPLRIVLHASGRVTGRVPGLEPGASLEVGLYSQKMSGAGTYQIAEDGRFGFTAPRHGLPFLYKFERPGFAPLFLEHAALRRGEDLDLGDLQFGQGSTLVGVIETQEGVAIAGAKVHLIERWLGQTLETGKDGRFAFSNLPERPIWLRIDAPSHPPHFVILQARSSTTHHRVTLSPGGHLTGDVLDADEKPLDGAGFMVFWDITSPLDADLDHLRLGYRLSKDGNVKLLLQPGMYRLRATAPESRVHVDQRVEIRAGKTTTLRLRMPPR